MNTLPEIIGAFGLVGACCLITFIITYEVMDSRHKRYLIERGMGEWKCDPKTGISEFVEK